MKNPIDRRKFGESFLRIATTLAGVVVFRHAEAASLSQPAERPILTVVGRITATNKADAAQFDRTMLEALGAYGFETTTPWYKGPVRFDGVLMSRLMQEVGATGDTVVIYAINDYSTEIPIDDFARYNVLLAMKRDGQYMSVRDKGPLFIVYPYDSLPELKHQRYYSRSVWQVARLVVK